MSSFKQCDVSNQQHIQTRMIGIHSFRSLLGRLSGDFLRELMVYPKFGPESI
jgi:hypothetical protein